jgi:hypothetical protein
MAELKVSPGLEDRLLEYEEGEEVMKEYKGSPARGR